MGEPSSLWEDLDQMERAEPLDPEEDLVIRMQAVSKLRGAQAAGAGPKERRMGAKPPRDPFAGGVSKSAISKPARRPPTNRTNKPEGMKIEGAHSGAAKPSAVAAAAAMAVANAQKRLPGVALQRSYSI